MFVVLNIFNKFIQKEESKKNVIMPRRKTCSYCKAVKMNYDEASCNSNVGRGKKDCYIGDRYPAEDCPKPITLKEFNYLMYKRYRGSAAGEIE